jgi:hypothetical protein
MDHHSQVPPFVMTSNDLKLSVGVCRPAAQAGLGAAAPRL